MAQIKRKLKQSEKRLNQLNQQLNQLQQSSNKRVKAPRVKTRKPKSKGKSKDKLTLKMDTFDLSIAKKIVDSNMKKESRKKKFLWAISFKKKKSSAKFGDAKEKEYDYNSALLDTTILICRENGWFTEDSWIKHKVPINTLFNNLWKSSIEYSKIKKYYLRNFFDERKRSQIGVKNE